MLSQIEWLEWSKILSVLLSAFITVIITYGYGIRKKFFQSFYFLILNLIYNVLILCLIITFNHVLFSFFYFLCATIFNIFIDKSNLVLEFFSFFTSLFLLLFFIKLHYYTKTENKKKQKKSNFLLIISDKVYSFMHFIYIKPYNDKAKRIFAKESENYLVVDLNWFFLLISLFIINFGYSLEKNFLVLIFVLIVFLYSFIGMLYNSIVRFKDILFLNCLLKYSDDLIIKYREHIENNGFYVEESTLNERMIEQIELGVYYTNMSITNLKKISGKKKVFVFFSEKTKILLDL